MNELPPDIADILRAARGAHDPSADDEARVLRAVYATTGVLGGAALGGSAAGTGAGGGAATGTGALGVAKVGGAGAALKGAGAVAGAKAAGMGLASKLVASALVLAGAGGGYAALRGHTAPEAPAVVAARVPQPAPAHTEQAATEAPRAPEAAAQPTHDDDAPGAAELAPPVAPVAPPEAPSHTHKPHAHAAHAERAAGGQGAELGLIRATQAALRDGQPARALELLREHAARFPQGILSEERTGLEAIARCNLGQTSEGRRVAHGFALRAPASPLLERVRAACGDTP